MKRMEKNPPRTPGEILIQDFLKPRGMPQSNFALRIGVTGACINHIVSGRNRVSAQLALRFEAVLKTPARFWLEAQMTYDLYLAEMDEYATLERRDMQPIG